MTDLLRTYSKIKNLIPRLLEIREGCEIAVIDTVNNFRHEAVICDVDNHFYGVRFHENGEYDTINTRNADIEIEIYGHAIKLEDVLEAFYKADIIDELAPRGHILADCDGVVYLLDQGELEELFKWKMGQGYHAQTTDTMVRITNLLELNND